MNLQKIFFQAREYGQWLLIRCIRFAKIGTILICSQYPACDCLNFLALFIYSPRAGLPAFISSYYSRFWQYSLPYRRGRVGHASRGKSLLCFLSPASSPGSIPFCFSCTLVIFIYNLILCSSRPLCDFLISPFRPSDKRIADSGPEQFPYCAGRPLSGLYISHFQ